MDRLSIHNWTAMLSAWIGFAAVVFTAIAFFSGASYFVVSNMIKIADELHSHRLEFSEMKTILGDVKKNMIEVKKNLSKVKKNIDSLTK
uniref:DUF948 domain-containing protein n=1 Tax=Meloidogyne hapla TaxID=6305 RepID=A0A1I8BS90_MELHA